MCDLLITYIPLGAMLRPMRKVTSASAVTLSIPPEHELIGELLSWISFLFQINLAS